MITRINDYKEIKHMSEHDKLCEAKYLVNSLQDDLLMLSDLVASFHNIDLSDAIDDIADLADLNELSLLKVMKGE